MKEATARIKINKLLEAAGWRFFSEGKLPANIQLEPSVTIKVAELDALGNDFEKTVKGFVDFLLLDSRGFPLIVLEAKSEDNNPLVGKEQARKYARSQNCRFVILSNGNLHYFWDLDRGNPYIITTFPTPDSVMGYQKVAPDPKRLIEETVGDDYIVLTQRPSYAAEAGWRNESERSGYVQANKLRFLRPYQLVDEIQRHSKPVIEHCYREFLLRNNDCEEREYPDPEDQIREVLIHGNYLSQRDIEICLSFDLSTFEVEPEYKSIRQLHDTLAAAWGSSDI
jgi:type I site-specific restriction endonuclease